VTALLRSLLRASRARTAALMLGVFVLGAALHGLHHLKDPACADGVGRDGHACAVCSSLHASTLVPQVVLAPVPSTIAWSPTTRALAPAPARRAPHATAPRAPPAG